METVLLADHKDSADLTLPAGNFQIDYEGYPTKNNPKLNLATVVSDAGLANYILLDKKLNHLIYSVVTNEIYGTADTLKYSPLQGLPMIYLLKGGSIDMSLVQELELNAGQISELVEKMKDVPITVVTSDLNKYKDRYAEALNRNMVESLIPLNGVYSLLTSIAKIPRNQLKNAPLM